MAKQPGPRQVFPANITRISFPSIGGLVFFRVAQHHTSTPPVAAPDPSALVLGLPWGPFDMFALNDGKADPESKQGGVSITDPVTAKMLDKYLYWAPKPKVHVSATKTIVGSSQPTFVLDVASWSPIIKHNIAFRITPPMEREAARLLYIDIYTDEGAIPSLFGPDDVGVTVINNIGRELSEQEIIAIAPSAGWSYHYEPNPVPDAKTTTVDDVALLILNLAKLYRDMPLVSGKKPTTFEFKVRAPSYPGGSGSISFSWDLTASAWVPKSSTPPKAKERLSFPVEDGPGVYMTPTFPHPDNLASAGAGSQTGQEEINIQITFGVAGVAPVILMSTGSGGGSSSSGSEG